MTLVVTISKQDGTRVITTSYRVDDEYRHRLEYPGHRLEYPVANSQAILEMDENVHCKIGDSVMVKKSRSFVEMVSIYN